MIKKVILEDGRIIIGKQQEIENIVFVEIQVPYPLFEQSEEIQKKLNAISILYSDTYRKLKNGVITIGNINLEDVTEFLDKEQYTQLKAVGVVFPKEIDDLFTPPAEEEAEETEEETLSPNEEEEDAETT